MKEVQDRVVQFSNRYKLTNAETGEVLGTFDFDEVTGTVQQVGTEIDAELFDSIAADLAARVKLSGGELAGTVVTFSDISGTAANVASGDTSATLWGKVKNWFSRLKALAFKNKVAAGDFEAGAIKNADVAADAAIAQSKINGLESALAAKQNTITGGASTIASQNLTANRALVSNDSGKVAVSAVTATELGYLDGVTSNIQSQFNNSGKINSDGGFQGGTGASAGRGAAIGNGASAELGGAVGNKASAYTGGAVGYLATVTADGFAGGQEASATRGGAVGCNASATNGFAGGYSALATANGAVQLGTGQNKTENTLQFRGYQIVDANGNIPASRLSANSPVRSVNGKTGAVSLSAADVGAATAAQGAKADSAAQLNKAQTWTQEQRFNAGFSALNGNFSFSDTTNIGMELGRRDGTAGTPYIDFHTDGSSSTDYNSRLLATGNQLQVTASGGFSVNGKNIEIFDSVVDTGNAVTVTAPTSGDTIQAPDNGWFCLNLHATATGFVRFVQKDADGTDKWGAVNLTLNYEAGWPTFYLPVKSGDLVKVTWNNATVNRLQFIRTTSLRNAK